MPGQGHIELRTARRCHVMTATAKKSSEESRVERVGKAQTVKAGKGAAHWARS